MYMGTSTFECTTSTGQVQVQVQIQVHVHCTSTLIIMYIQVHLEVLKYCVINIISCMNLESLNLHITDIDNSLAPVMQML